MTFSLCMRAFLECNSVSIFGSFLDGSIRFHSEGLRFCSSSFVRVRLLAYAHSLSSC